MNAPDPISTTKYPLDDVFSLLDGGLFDEFKDSKIYISDLRTQPVKTHRNLCLIVSLNSTAHNFKNFMLEGICPFF